MTFLERGNINKIQIQGCRLVQSHKASPALGTAHQHPNWRLCLSLSPAELFLCLCSPAWDPTHLGISAAEYPAGPASCRPSIHTALKVKYNQDHGWRLHSPPHVPQVWSTTCSLPTYLLGEHFTLLVCIPQLLLQCFSFKQLLSLAGWKMMHTPPWHVPCCCIFWQRCCCWVACLQPDLQSTAITQRLEITNESWKHWHTAFNQAVNSLVWELVKSHSLWSAGCDAVQETVLSQGWPVVKSQVTHSTLPLVKCWYRPNIHPSISYTASTLQ